jgi:uncharacterized protein YkwD
MARAVAVLAVAVGMLLGAASAFGGSSIHPAPACPNAYVVVGPSAAAQKQFRATMLCLINAVRQAERLPALKLANPLDEVATAQADKFARTGTASHGSSITDIAKRFVAKGYHPAAYDEGFDYLPTGATPYWFISDILSRRGLPCTQVLDPRFRDFGVASGGGVTKDNPVPFIATLAMEFGLRAGQRQPSSNTRPAASCPHNIPAPVVKGLPVQDISAPAPSGGTLGITVKCAVKVPCTLTASMTLPDVKATVTTPGPVTISAGRSQLITFTFTPAQVQQEEQRANPVADVVEHITAPVIYEAKTSEFLPSATS